MNTYITQKKKRKKTSKSKQRLLLKQTTTTKQKKQWPLRHGCAYCYRPHGVVLVPKPVTPTNRQQKLVQDEESEVVRIRHQQDQQKHPASQDQQDKMTVE